MSRVGDEVVIEVMRVGEDGLNDDLSLPEYMTEGSAGMDVRAAVPRAHVLRPGARTILPTGLALAIPQGYEVQVRPRSGLAFRHGVTVLNAPGTIDSDYRGELRILLVNLGDEDFTIKRGERIAQLVVARAYRAAMHEVEALNDSARGTGGFGHTGRG